MLYTKLIYMSEFKLGGLSIYSLDVSGGLGLCCHCLEFLLLEGSNQLRRAAFNGSSMISPVLTFILEFGIV